MSGFQSSLGNFSAKKMASVFGEGLVTLRVSNAKIDTPVPPKLLFAVGELRQQRTGLPGGKCSNLSTLRPHRQDNGLSGDTLGEVPE